jgi:hypothetical protein
MADPTHKVSDAFLRFAEPVIEIAEHLGRPKELEKVLGMAALVWNAIGATAKKRKRAEPELEVPRDVAEAALDKAKAQLAESAT